MTMHVLYVILAAWLCVCLSPFFGANAEADRYTDENSGKQYVVMFTEDLKHDVNQKICNSLGGFLPEPKNKAENDFLNSLGTNTFLLGMSDKLQEGHWLWDSDQTPVVWASWEDWNTNPEPNGGEEEACAIMMRNEKDYSIYANYRAEGWADYSCNSTLDLKKRPSSLICQINKDNITEVTQLPGRTTEQCYSSYNASDNGVITSPNYPNNYPNFTSCVYSITADAGQLVRLTFNDFQLEGGSYCDADFVTLQDWDGNDIGEKLCGENVTNVIIAPGNQINLNFTSDASFSMRGFNASFSQEPCVSYYNASDNGVITSPNYPNNYPPYASCQYVITADEGHVVHLTFNDFQLEDYCRFDNVTIQDGDANEIGENLCGANLPSEVISPGNKLIVTFTSDGNTNKRGFNVSYNQLSVALLNLIRQKME